MTAIKVPSKRDRILLIVERDGPNCCLCGDPVDLAIYGHGPVSPTLEHIVPKSRGGANKLFNLALAHKICNERRGNTKLAREQSVPPLSTIQCNYCGAPFANLDAMDAHRFCAHGFLSPRWEVHEEPTRPTAAELAEWWANIEANLARRKAARSILSERAAKGWETRRSTFCNPHTHQDTQ